MASTVIQQLSKLVSGAVSDLQAEAHIPVAANSVPIVRRDGLLLKRQFHVSFRSSSREAPIASGISALRLQSAVVLQLFKPVMGVTMQTRQRNSTARERLKDLFID